MPPTVQSSHELVRRVRRWAQQRHYPRLDHHPTVGGPHTGRRARRHIGRARRTIRTHLSGTCTTRSSNTPFQYRIEGDDLTITRTGHKLNGTWCCPHFAFRAEGAPASDEHRLCSVSYTPPDVGEPAEGSRPRGRQRPGIRDSGPNPLKSLRHDQFQRDRKQDRSTRPHHFTRRPRPGTGTCSIRLIPDTTARAQYVAKGSSPVEPAIHKLDGGFQQGVCQVVTRPIEPADIVLIDAKGTTIATHADPPSHRFHPAAHSLLAHPPIRVRCRRAFELCPHDQTSAVSSRLLSHSASARVAQVQIGVRDAAEPEVPDSEMVICCPAVRLMRYQSWSPATSSAP